MTLDGNQVPLDALDHARALMAEVEAHPNDRAALDALRDVLTRMDQVADEAPIPWTTWAEHPEPPTPRRWLVRDWLPAGRVALLTGPGGVGKSRLVLQLAAGIASGGGQGDAWIDTPDTDTLRLAATLQGRRALGMAPDYASSTCTWWTMAGMEIYRRLAQLSGDAARVADRLQHLHLVDMDRRSPRSPRPGRGSGATARSRGPGCSYSTPWPRPTPATRTPGVWSAPSCQTGTPGAGPTTARSSW